jgi:hypothetical protein
LLKCSKLLHCSNPPKSPLYGHLMHVVAQLLNESLSYKSLAISNPHKRQGNTWRYYSISGKKLKFAGTNNNPLSCWQCMMVNANPQKCSSIASNSSSSPPLMNATFTTNYTFAPLAVFIVLTIGMLPWKKQSNRLQKWKRLEVICSSASVEHRRRIRRL